MPTLPKYSLSEPSIEEKKSFMKDFNELLEKHSMYFEPIIKTIDEREILPDGRVSWTTKRFTDIFINKKLEIPEKQNDNSNSGDIAGSIAS